MNKRELIALVAEKTGESKKTVSTITSSLMTIIAESVENSTSIKTDNLIFRAATIKARPASNDAPEKPEKKVLKVSLRSKQDVVE